MRNKNVCVSRCNFFFLVLMLAISLNDTKIQKKKESITSHPPRKLSSRDIDTSLNHLNQDDPRLIEILKEHYLYPPSNKPYNFSNENPVLKD